MSVIFEVGFSESYEDLVKDAKQWLSRSSDKVEVVFLIDIKEDKGLLSKQKKEPSTERRINLLLRHYGTIKAKEKYLHCS